MQKEATRSTICKEPPSQRYPSYLHQPPSPLPTNPISPPKPDIKVSPHLHPAHPASHSLSSESRGDLHLKHVASNAHNHLSLQYPPSPLTPGPAQPRPTPVLQSRLDIPTVHFPSPKIRCKRICCCRRCKSAGMQHGNLPIPHHAMHDAHLSPADAGNQSLSPIYPNTRSKPKAAERYR